MAILADPFCARDHHRMTESVDKIQNLRASEEYEGLIGSSSSYFSEGPRAGAIK